MKTLDGVCEKTVRKGDEECGERGERDGSRKAGKSDRRRIGRCVAMHMVSTKR